MRISAEELSQPISEESPCGDDLEYDPAFQEMELLAQPKEEQEFGDSVTPYEPPDWKGVAKQVEDLLGRTRDLRVFVFAAAAGLHSDGIGTFRDAVQAINDNLEAHWDDLHPELDEDEDDDPTLRYNALNNLNDHDNFAEGLRRARLIEVTGVGPISLADIELATGRREPDDDEEKLDIALIKGAFADTDLDQFETLLGDIRGAADQVERLETVWAEKVTATADGQYKSLLVDVDAVKAVLAELKDAVTEYAPVAIEDDEAAGEGASGGNGAAAPAAAGEIRTRQDIIRALDRICDFYAKNEPSSPVPLLLRRAQRLVNRSFMEILQDIAPESLERLRDISGQQAEEGGE